MGLFVGYEPAARCTGGPTAGAKAVMAWFLGAYIARGGTNLGIYNCRAVAGSTTTSLHGEGRAADLGINPHGAGYGDEVAELLRGRSAELGIQCVIWRRRIWSGSYPNDGWRPYTGTNAHVDHIHLELARAAAATLTAARVAQVLSPTPSPPVRPAEVTVKTPAVIPAVVLRRGMQGALVGKLQSTLKAWFPHMEPYRSLRVDSDYGPATEAAVKAAQIRFGLVADGVAGPRTLAALNLKL